MTLFSSQKKNKILLWIVLFLTILLVAPTLLDLIQIWYANRDYSHGFLVIPLSLYYVWINREKLNNEYRKGSWFGLVLLCLSILSYLVAYITRFHTLTHMSLLAIFLSLVFFLAGWNLTVKLLPPILFLLFMFPIPSAYYIQLTNPLKLFISDISSKLINFLGIPIYREGNLLYMSSLQLEVAEACSGLRSLYSYLMLGCVFAASLRLLRNKFFIILSTIPLTMIVNILRVTGTAILAKDLGVRVAQGFYHEFSGIILFAIGFLLLFIEYLLIRSKWDCVNESQA